MDQAALLHAMSSAIVVWLGFFLMFFWTRIPLPLQLLPVFLVAHDLSPQRPFAHVMCEGILLHRPWKAIPLPFFVSIFILS